jgi:hypothetical protein
MEREMSRESIFEHKNWTVKEKVRLMIFLGHYHGLPDWGSERKSIHLYKHLSTFLKKTRTPEQCKNIHSLLKRKFASLQEVVDAMQAELENEDNYEKIATKYEREIEKFEAENRLFDGVAEDRKGFEPLRSKRVTEREERECELKVSVGRSKEEEEDLKINLNEYIKCEEQPMGGALAQRRDELVRSCNAHFQEWLKCIKVLEFKN